MASIKPVVADPKAVVKPVKNKVQILLAKIKKIQNDCYHLSADVVISYYDHDYRTGDACGNAWTETSTYTSFHCTACEKKWNVKEKITRRKYADSNARLVAEKEHRVLQKKTSRAKAGSSQIIRL